MTDDVCTSITERVPVRSSTHNRREFTAERRCEVGNHCAQDRWTGSEGSDVDRLLRTMQEIGQAEDPSSGVPAHRCSSSYPSILDSSSSRPPAFELRARRRALSRGTCAVYNECDDIKQCVISHASRSQQQRMYRKEENIQGPWIRAAASVDLQELDLELQRRIRGDHGREAPRAICLHRD